MCPRRPRSTRGTVNEAGEPQVEVVAAVNRGVGSEADTAGPDGPRLGSSVGRQGPHGHQFIAVVFRAQAPRAHQTQAGAVQRQRFAGVEIALGPVADGIEHEGGAAGYHCSAGVGTQRRHIPRDGKYTGRGELHDAGRNIGLTGVGVCAGQDERVAANLGQVACPKRAGQGQSPNGRPG